MKRALPILVAALIVLLLCGIITWAFVYRFSPPNVWHNPPIYSGAQNLDVQDYGDHGTRLKDRGNFYLNKMIRYNVAVDVSAVKAFYSSNLGGYWTVSDWGKLDPKSDSLAFQWTTSDSPPSVYFLDINATTRSEGGTNVQIAALRFPGY